MNKEKIKEINSRPPENVIWIKFTDSNDKEHELMVNLTELKIDKQLKNKKITSIVFKEQVFRDV